MPIKLNKLMLMLLCAAPLALAACQTHEHPGDSAAGSGSSEEHPGDGESGDEGDSEHPGEE